MRNRRQQQQARRRHAAGELAQRAQRAAPRHDVTESVEDMPTLALADVGMHPQAGTTRPAKPRKCAAEHLVDQTNELVAGVIVMDGKEQDESVERGIE